MQIGTVTRSFPEFNSAGAAAKMADIGFQSTEPGLVQPNGNFQVENRTNNRTNKGSLIIIEYSRAGNCAATLTRVQAFDRQAKNFKEV